MASTPFGKSELNQIRDLFPLTKTGRVYMNHAAISPLPTPTFETTRRCLEIRISGAVENFEEGMQMIENARSRAASYINARSEEQITFLGNTSDAISAVAEGLTWHEGDEIILNTIEFPTNVQPFRRLESLGVSINYVEANNHSVSADDVEALITPKTKLVSISAVQYLSGFRADLKAIGDLCSKHDILFVVDAIQALGATPVDVQACNIDALGTGAHKWLMSPMGVGFLYLSDRMSSHIEPYKTGWLSVEDPWELSEFEKSWLPVNQHLETGTPNLIGISGLGASLKLFDDIGINNIKQHILHLSGSAIDGLKFRDGAHIITPEDEASRMGIVTFSIEGTTKEKMETVIKTLKEEQITISAREGFFRISPHFYNTEAEIDKVINRLFAHL
jgi:selenocysteine lyase/cysteine desulfurase